MQGASQQIVRAPSAPPTNCTGQKSFDVSAKCNWLMKLKSVYIDDQWIEGSCKAYKILHSAQRVDSIHKNIKTVKAHC